MKERREQKNKAQRLIISKLMNEDDVHAELHRAVEQVADTAAANTVAIQILADKQNSFEIKFSPILELQEEIAAVGRFGRRLQKIGAVIAIAGAGIAIAWHYADVALHKVVSFFTHTNGGSNY